MVTIVVCMRRDNSLGFFLLKINYLQQGAHHFNTRQIRFRSSHQDKPWKCRTVKAWKTFPERQEEVQQ